MLDEILLGKTRAAILREIYLNPDRRTSFNELVRRTGSGAGAVSRELKTLISAGVVQDHREGNQRFITAAAQSPVFQELRALINRTSGAPAILREALRNLAQEIGVAVVIGSVARGEEHAGSDLDLLVIGTAGYSAVAQCIHALGDRLGRQVQILYYDLKSSADRASLAKPAAHALASGPKLFVIGNETKLQSLLKEGSHHDHPEKPGQPRQAETARAPRRRAQLAHAKRPR